MGDRWRTIFPKLSSFTSTTPGWTHRGRFALFLFSAFLAAGCGTTGEISPLSASGRVEVTAVTVSSKVGGRVVRLLVKEGDEVKAGRPRLSYT